MIFIIIKGIRNKLSLVYYKEKKQLRLKYLLNTREKAFLNAYYKTRFIKNFKFFLYSTKTIFRAYFGNLQIYSPFRTSLDS